MAVMLGLAGYSNSGKTTLITKLLPQLKKREIRTAVIKHDGHGHYKEAEGTDSAAFIHAGAEAMITLSQNAVHIYRSAVMELEEASAALEGHSDLIIVEGFKQSPIPKIALIRTEEQARIIELLPAPPIAYITLNEAWLPKQTEGASVFHPDQIDEIASFISMLLPKVRQTD